jgi:hypothetical protein
MLLGAYFREIPGTTAAGVFGTNMDDAGTATAAAATSPVVTSDESAETEDAKTGAEAASMSSAASPLRGRMREV